MATVTPTALKSHHPDVRQVLRGAWRACLMTVIYLLPVIIFLALAPDFTALSH